MVKGCINTNHATFENGISSVRVLGTIVRRSRKIQGHTGSTGLAARGKGISNVVVLITARGGERPLIGGVRQQYRRTTGAGHMDGWTKCVIGGVAIYLFREANISAFLDVDSGC